MANKQNFNGGLKNDEEIMTGVSMGQSERKKGTSREVVGWLGCEGGNDEGGGG